MNMTNQENGFRMVELAKKDVYLRELKSKYVTLGYYDLSVCHSFESWKIDLTLKPLEKKLEKNYQGRLFEDHIEEPRVFAAMLGDRQTGWIELGYEKWNNRMRVWEFLVEEESRRKHIGLALMNHAVKISKEKSARMLMLETQTCNVPAINFYLKFGFELIGFDTSAYSNQDIEKKEIRLELGLKL